MDEPTGSHRCTTILYFTWKIFTCLFTHVMLVTLVVSYCVLGAVTFSRLEGENEVFVSRLYTRPSHDNIIPLLTYLRIINHGCKINNRR